MSGGTRYEREQTTSPADGEVKGGDRLAALLLRTGTVRCKMVETSLLISLGVKYYPSERAVTVYYLLSTTQFYNENVRENPEGVIYP